MNPLSVSIGPYTASSYATTTAEEALLTADMASHPALPTWYFGRLDVSLPVAYNDGRLLIFNISVSSGGVGRSWSSIAAGTYDAGLTTVLNSVHAMTSTTVYLSIFQEADGGAAQNADIANGGSGSHADFAAAFAHIAALAAIHCPNATITQNYASSTHLSTWAVCPAAQALGFDPHNYFGNTTAFSTFLSATQTALNNAGQGSTPWIINTGVAEEAIGGSDKADWFTAMFTALWDAKTAYPHLVFATYWNTDSANINGHPATESIDSAGTNPGALAAYKAGLATLYGGSGPPPPPPPVGAGVNLCLWVGGAAWHEVPSPEYSAATWYQQKLNRAFVVRPRGAYGTSWPAGVASNTPLIKWPTQLGVFAKQQFGGYSTNIKFFTDDPAGTNPDGTPKNPPADTLAHLLQGNYDSWLAAQVGDLKTLAGQGVTVWCEIWSEMNVATPNSAQPAASDGPWVAASGGGNITFGTGGTVERFRDFYCYIVNFFDAAGVSNVRWVASLSSNKTTTWGGTVGGGTNASSTDIQVFIDPILAKETTDGKRYIDVIGNDMYNRAGNNFSPTTMYGPGLAAAKLRHKPFGIFECGKTEAPAGASAAVLAQKGQWYTDIGTFCTANDADMEFFAFTCSERFFPPEEYVDPFDGTVANIDPRNGYGSPSWTSFLAMTQLPVFNTTTGKHFGAARLSGTGTFRATGGVTTVHRSGAARLSGVGTLVANAFAPGLSRRNASSGSTSGHSITPAFNTATLAGSTVVLALWVSGGSTAPTVLTAPSGSATYTLGLSYTEPNQGFGLFVYYLFNSVATEPAFTVAFSTGVTYIEYSMAELVGLTTTDPLDLTRATVGSGTPESVFGPALATAQHSEWAMAVLGNVAGTSPSAPTNGYVLSGTAPVVARLLAGFKPLSTGTETLGFSVTGGNATARYAGGVLTFEALNGDPGITNWYGAATLTGRGLLPTATGQRGIIGRTDSANLHGVGTLSATGVKAGTSLNGSATLYGFSGFRATAKTVTPATGEVLLRISDFPRAIQKG